MTGFLPDTFLKPTSFARGVAFVNGVNLGRFWTDAGGPVGALYVPGPYLNADGPNELVVVELDRADCGPAAPRRCYVEFVDRQVLIDADVEAEIPKSRVEAFAGAV